MFHIFLLKSKWADGLRVSKGPLQTSGCMQSSPSQVPLPDEKLLCALLLCRRPQPHSLPHIDTQIPGSIAGKLCHAASNTGRNRVLFAVKRRTTKAKRNGGGVWGRDSSPAVGHLLIISGGPIRQPEEGQCQGKKGCIDLEVLIGGTFLLFGTILIRDRSQR